MKILILTSRVPYPLEKGDKLRIFNQIKHLNKEHEVIVCAVDTEYAQQKNIDEVKKYCHQFHVLSIPKWKVLLQLIVGFFSSLPFQVSYFHNSSCQKQLDKIIEDVQPDFIYSHLIRTSEYVKHKPIPKLLDYMDAFSIGIERRISKQYFFLKWIFRMEYNRLKKYESEVFDYFDEHSIISSKDREFILHPSKGNIKIIPNGIDASFFKRVEMTKKYDILFTGNMNYPPNVEAANFLAKKVVPLLMNNYPNVKLLIAGANPNLLVKSLANENVEVSGWVDDIRTCYNQSKVFVAPMQIGTGLQNKLLEAMSMQLPCITSELANSSLNARKNKEILVGTSPEDFANHIDSLLKDELKSSTLANKGYEFIINTYGWDKCNSILSDLIEQTVSKKQ